MHHAPPRRLAVLALAVPLALTGCASTGPGTAAPAGTASSAGAASPQDEAPRATEAQARTARLAVTYDGGVRVLDAQTLEEVGDIELAGFSRLNPAGDGRHLLVSTTGGFRVLDTGTWAEAHGDHAHFWTADPVLTDVTDRKSVV